MSTNLVSKMTLTLVAVIWLLSTDFLLPMANAEPTLMRFKPAASIFANEQQKDTNVFDTSSNDRELDAQRARFELLASQHRRDLLVQSMPFELIASQHRRDLLVQSMPFELIASQHRRDLLVQSMPFEPIASQHRRDLLVQSMPFELLASQHRRDLLVQSMPFEPLASQDRRDLLVQSMLFSFSLGGSQSMSYSPTFSFPTEMSFPAFGSFSMVDGFDNNAISGFGESSSINGINGGDSLSSKSAGGSLANGHGDLKAYGASGERAMIDYVMSVSARAILFGMLGVAAAMVIVAVFVANERSNRRRAPVHVATWSADRSTTTASQVMV